ncbi:MAG: maleylpyruvate isomerase family mycothiol-dependent enzyme [Actinomycetia bacterium]|nr:maleylpyruvate isomerase family mycothiol-dependent enzyme [Actinomycetes bacterium]MCP4959905.1 maleylpyruvate isomerase family mycothiol-dependent enzyme [Actinomycetes bacterium]
MSSLDNTDYIDAVEDVLQRTLELARGLTEDDGRLPTGCPGWSVFDNIAHMVGLEQVLNGAPDPDIDLPPLDHVESDIDIYMEKQVHVRRELPLVSVVDELSGLIPRRIASLREAAAMGDPLLPGPFGGRAMSKSLPVRIFDLWAHEQDIRRAVGLPVRDDCAAAEMSLERSILGWSRAIPAMAEGLDGVVRIECTGPDPSEVTVPIGQGGAELARIRGDLDSLTRTFCGRGDVDPSLLSGDPTLVERLSDNLNLTP